MKDTLSFVFVLLIATTTLNRGEKIEELKIKELNDKRYPRTMTFPRPGRSPGMTGFTRIDRASGLMPFPRVGRSDSSDYDIVLDFNPEDISEVKRQGLIPYPRVGRSREVASPFYGNEIVKLGKVKRTTSSGDAASNGGMWFGPRLGRLHRRDDQQIPDDQQWAVFPLRDFPPSPIVQSDNFASRLGHIESDQDDGLITSNTGVY